MQGLLDRFQEMVNLGYLPERRLVIIESLEGLRSIRQGARVGEQNRLRSTALGKAVLATYADNEALALLRAQSRSSGSRYGASPTTTPCWMSCAWCGSGAMPSTMKRARSASAASVSR